MWSAHREVAVQFGLRPGVHITSFAVYEAAAAKGHIGGFQEATAAARAHYFAGLCSCKELRSCPPPACGVLHSDFVFVNRYDEEMAATLAAAREVGSAEEAAQISGDVVLRYDSQEHYERVAAGFGMLLEWRDGVPRGAHNGVVNTPPDPCS